ncbi:Zinc finger, C3HC4 type (RING finger) [Musa troglodytarum]|uniref:RING-type E3 ubiquitin transferase n=1 Tax=Musa troglodytarum TaxID=320322 RepID=A0A9E7HCR1_9LILI|nr:Zinc finger, C3HC4 type (RING finger) [Musa troglodytarum]
MTLHHCQLALVSHLQPRLLLEAADDDAGAAPSPLASARPSSFDVPFRPGIAVIVGVLTIIFSLTFLLLYARHCKHSATSFGRGRGATGGPLTSAPERRHSGVDRAVVESLPVFRFGSLQGQKEGLECAVCLSRFEPAEALRLLPKCRHGFHVECVDTWLDAHSTCPLCRVRVDPEDVLLFPPQEPEPHGGGEKAEVKGRGDETATAVPNPFGRRISGRHSSAGERTSVSHEIVVHTAEPAAPRRRRSADCPGCATAAQAPRVRRDALLLTEATEDSEAFERRHSHRIVVSDADALVDRWSDLRTTDMLFLRREMIITESGRFSASKAVRALSSPAAIVDEELDASRCASEIAGVRRVPSCGATGGASRLAEEERTLRRWLGFAAMRTAVRWLGKREGVNRLEA